MKNKLFSFITNNSKKREEEIEKLLVLSNYEKGLFSDKEISMFIKKLRFISIRYGYGKNIEDMGDFLKDRVNTTTGNQQKFWNIVFNVYTK